MSNYPNRGLYGMSNLFLAFAGYSIGADGSQHLQTWNRDELLPILTHLDSATGLADGEMFTDFLFLAIAVKNSAGEMKYLVRNDEAPGDFSDWQTYMHELFLPGGNLSALADAALYNGLGRTIPVDIWIGLPYPHPRLYSNDSQRAAAVKLWINLFLANWHFHRYRQNLCLRGFYWVQESDYYQGPLYYDSYLMCELNSYIHKNYVHGRQLRSLWIPYQLAAHWDHWSSFGFDLSILQPSSYFNPSRSLESGAADAFDNQQGVEMEMDLAVLSDQVHRSRFIEYMNAGATGGYDPKNRYFAPYLNNAPLAWYVGGWYWDGSTKQHALLSLYAAKDRLYDSIYEYVQGIYRTGSAV